jgi:BirA family biotin operon repressor/biotin-[acetyl-CoA-carboxylase] ligase
MAQFQTDWQQRDVLLGRQVQALSGTDVLLGLASGINNQGQLIIEFNDGSIKNLSSADVSVRM